MNLIYLRPLQYLAYLILPCFFSFRNLHDNVFEFFKQMMPLAIKHVAIYRFIDICVHKLISLVAIFLKALLKIDRFKKSKLLIYNLLNASYGIAFIILTFLSLKDEVLLRPFFPACLTTFKIYASAVNIIANYLNLTLLQYADEVYLIIYYDAIIYSLVCLALVILTSALRILKSLIKKHVDVRILKVLKWIINKLECLVSILNTIYSFDDILFTAVSQIFDSAIERTTYELIFDNSMKSNHNNNVSNMKLWY